ncbi:MAG: hypothetical protein KH431_08375 [Erysipelotrichaceae bacterium]|nr:hypothetical protein [Erysipelotrichaceae bacterium]
MQYSFTFTLSADEYVEFIRWQALQAKLYRGLRMLINASIITFLICTVIFFTLYKSWIWMGIVIALGFLWLLYGAPYTFQLLLRHRIQKDILTKLGITGFQPVTIDFDSHGVHYQMHEKRFLPYEQIIKVIPLHNVFVIIGSSHDTLLLPYTVFSDDSSMRTFLRDFEKQCNGWKGTSI